MMVSGSDGRRPVGRWSNGGLAIKPLKGFTLIELMIVVAIIAIIAAIAYPSYIKSVTKTKRSAAEACLSEYANYMERYYTTNLRYDQAGSAATAAANPAKGTPTPLTLDCASPQNSGADYTFGVAATASTYMLTAAPKPVQASRDAKCGSLTLDQQGNRGISGSGPVADCW